MFFGSFYWWFIPLLTGLAIILAGKKHLSALPPGRRTQSKDDERGRGKSQESSSMALLIFVGKKVSDEIWDQGKTSQNNIRYQAEWHHKRYCINLVPFLYNNMSRLFSSCWFAGDFSMTSSTTARSELPLLEQRAKEALEVQVGW